MGILGLKGRTGPTAAVTQAAASEEDKWQHARFGDAPEVVPVTGPELVPGEAPEALEPTPDWSQLEKKNGDGLDSAADPAPAPWWKRKRVIIPSLVACLLVMGLAIGLGVGLNSKSSSDTDNTTEANKTTPASNVSCDGGLCPSILSLSVYEDELFVVARDTKNRVTIRPINTTTWEDEFVDLEGTPGELISQPTAFSWKVNNTWSRIDVFAVGSPNNTVYRRHYSEAEQWAEWEAEGTDIGSAVAACGPFPGKMDVWSKSKDRETIYHDWWYQKPDKEISVSGSRDGNTTEHGKMSEGENGWKEVRELSKVASAPAVVCRPSSIQADVLWYSTSTGALEHAGWNETGKRWTALKTFGEGFVGNPAVFTFDESSWDFFGVHGNGTVYHLGYHEFDGGHGKLQSLGGSVVSTPAAVSLKKGQMDVLALGVNGHLQHLRFDGREWADEWEDLEVEARSAPSAVVNDGRLTIVVVTEDGTLISLIRDADDNSATWKGSLKQEVVGRNISLEYF